MTKETTPSTAALWARFRFSVIGSLLSAPLARGELKAAAQSLAEKIWTHPVNGRDVQYAATTIERWYYKARNERDDPVRVLQRAVRKDSGKVSVAPQLAEHLRIGLLRSAQFQPLGVGVTVRFVDTVVAHAHAAGISFR